MSIMLALAVAVSALCVALFALVQRRGSAHRAPAPDGRAQNIAAARAQLDNLKQASADQVLNPSEAAAYQAEIHTRLLAEVAAAPVAAGGRPAAGKGVVGLAAVFLLLLSPLLYLLMGAPQLAGQQPAEVGEEALMQILEENPRDAAALARMGGLLMAQNRYAEALPYYRRARRIAGDIPQLLLPELEALMWLDDPDMDALLQVAQQSIPQQPLVLWIAGLRAQEKGDLAAAQGYWQQLSAQLAGTPMQADVEAALADVRALRGTAAEETAASGAAVTVVVAAAAEVRRQVAAETALFVIARGGDRALPLAARRASARQLPLTVVLDDSAAMTPAAKMSDADSYRIVARLSRSGDAIAQPGDFYGEAPAQPGGLVTVLIDRVAE